MKSRTTLFSLVPLAALSFIAAGCQLFVETSAGTGIGQPCTNNDECQGKLCNAGTCTAECKASTDCPLPSTCTDAGLCELKALGAQCVAADECRGGECFKSTCTSKCAKPSDCETPAVCATAGFCELPFKAAFIYVGVPQDEGWTLTHEQGRQYAMDNLAYLQSDFVQNTFLPDDAKKATDKFVSEGYDVVVANSFSLKNPLAEKANQYLDKKFLGCSTNVTGTNLGSYFGRLEQAYHLAGYAAALKTKSKRLGFVGSYITPEVVRHINAFTVGAHRIDPTIVVEVRWVGFWFDTTPNPPPGYVFAETRLTQELLATGCDVIAHNVDNGRPVEAVEKAFTVAKPIYSVGNDNADACVKGKSSCIGVPYWNWGPLYVRLFDEMHRGTWDPKKIVNDNIGLDPATSIVNFGINQDVAGSDVAQQVAILLGKLAASDGIGKAFEGKYCSTGQRKPTCVTDGAKEITDNELNTMCWFVEGVIDKTDPLDPLSADKPALVPSPDCENSL